MSDEVRLTMRGVAHAPPRIFLFGGMTLRSTGEAFAPQHRQGRYTTKV